jgi:hypothetical protein
MNKEKCARVLQGLSGDEFHRLEQLLDGGGKWWYDVHLLRRG